jgi:hypothetical protein
MDQTVHHKLLVRLVALAAVSFSLILVLRQDDQIGLGMAQSMPVFQPQAPIIVARNEPGSPLVISAERQLAKTEQAPELSFNVTNVTSKTVTAFAIKQEVVSGEKAGTTVYLYNLPLSATKLPPNSALNESATYDNLSDSQHRVTLTLDYVQFSDGKTWGSDSSKSGERVAGQNAASQIVITRLRGMIRDGNAHEDFAKTLESVTSIQPPAQHSDEWNEGFRLAMSTVADRLKRAHQLGGLGRVTTELTNLEMTLSGGR